MAAGSTQERRARQILAEVLGVAVQEVVSTGPVGGMTNRNFLCAYGARRYVVRIPGEGTGAMVNREREQVHTRTAQAYGWHPQVLYFDADGVKVTAYVEGARTLGGGLASRPDVLAGVARTLRELHESAFTMTADFSFRTEYARYVSMLTAPVSPTRYPQYAVCARVLPELERRSVQLGAERVP